MQSRLSSPVPCGMGGNTIGPSLQVQIAGHGPWKSVEQALVTPPVPTVQGANGKVARTKCSPRQGPGENRPPHVGLDWQRSEVPQKIKGALHEAAESDTRTLIVSNIQ